MLLEKGIELDATVYRKAVELKRLASIPLATDLVIESRLPLTSLSPGRFEAMLQSLEQQPVMQGLAAQKRQKDNELALAEKDRYPGFSAIVRYNGLWRSHDQRWMVGVGVNIPFDLGGKRSSNEARIRAQQSAVQWQLRDQHEQLKQNLIQAHSYWQQALDIYQLYKSDMLALANERLVTARDKYQSGDGDFLSVLTAHRDLLAMKEKTEKALYEQYVQFARLNEVAGQMYFNSQPSGREFSDSLLHQGGHYE